MSDNLSRLDTPGAQAATTTASTCGARRRNSRPYGRRGEDTVSGGYSEGRQRLQTADGIAERGVVTEVDIQSVAAAVPWLQGLKDYVQERLIPDTAKMVVTKDQIDLNFGKFGSASPVGEKHQTYLHTVIDSYRSIAQSLDAAVRATQDIVKNYKDVEHNNALTAKNIDAAFASSSSGSSGSSTSSGPPTQQTSGGQQTSSTQGSY
jgi:hypothetical protein